MAVGTLFLIFMPDNQLNARWLSPSDRKLAIERVRINQQGIGNKHFKLYQLKEALIDPLTWAFAFYALAADIPNGVRQSPELFLPILSQVSIRDVMPMLKRGS